MKNISHLMINENVTIKDAMELINQSASNGLPTGMLLIVDEFKRLSGVVSEGDIRKSLLKDGFFDKKISAIVNRSPITVCDYNPMSSYFLSIASQIESRQTKTDQIQNIPNYIVLVDDKRCPVDVLSFYDIYRLSNIKSRRVCVLGVGYVGLTLSLVLADKGFKVVGYDIDSEKISQLSRGEMTFYERGLGALLSKHINKGFSVTNRISSNMADIYIISVGTPVNKDNQAELNLLQSCAVTLSRILKRSDIVILRSTVPLSTCRNVVLPILEESGLQCGTDFHLAFAPERTIEGMAIEELTSLPQVVGAYDQHSLSVVTEFFRELTSHIVAVDSLEEAEMVKLANNTYRDLCFAFSNEMALICSDHNIDVNAVINAANEGYKRNKIPCPSPGVGGICLRKDPHIYSQSTAHRSKLADTSRMINDMMPQHLVNKIEAFLLKFKIQSPKIFLIGLAFKGDPETSDLRQSTSLDIHRLLQHRGYNNIVGYDPVAHQSEVLAAGVNYVSNEDGFKNTHVVAFLNNHKSYLDLDIDTLIRSSSKPLLFLDAWSLFSKNSFQGGSVYYSGLSFDMFRSEVISEKSALV